MNKTEQFIKRLTTSSLTDEIDFEGVNVQVSPSTKGCTSCAFETEKGATGCDYRTACMSHYRPDKESVVFTPKI